MPSTFLFQLAVFVISLIEESTTSDFNDLGKQLIGGFVAAVIVAVAFTFFKLRLREKHPPAPFISITASETADEAKVTQE
jgi:hypothetical protein